MAISSQRPDTYSAASADGSPLPRRLVAAVAAGTLLNPLNSSMIAVALGTLAAQFRVSAATATWLISGFYLAAAIGMPVLGQLADRYGPRRVFRAGLLLVGLMGALAPFAPAFGWLLACRVIQAFGSAAAYPAGLAIFRAQRTGGRPPAQALGALTVAASVSAALGPVFGGFLVALGGWAAIFWVNVPVTAVGLALSARWLPPDQLPAPVAGPVASEPSTLRAVLGALDTPGIALFAGLLAGALGFLLSLATRPFWPLVPLAALAGVLLFYRERHVAEPFFDVRLLAANRSLLAVFAQFAAVNVAFYGVFFGLPLWFEQVRHAAPEAAGLLLLPVSSIGVLATPVAARLIDRRGARPALLIGAAALLAGTLALLVFGPVTPVFVLLIVGALLGVPNGFNNLGLQALLYRHAKPGQMGTAGGQFQTFRYLGAILATALLGIAFAGGATTAGLHVVAGVLATLSALLLLAATRAERGG
jgi:MFS family permease